jgi:hypothetical protein
MPEFLYYILPPFAFAGLMFLLYKWLEIAGVTSALDSSRVADRLEPISRWPVVLQSEEACLLNTGGGHSRRARHASRLVMFSVVAETLDPLLDLRQHPDGTIYRGDDAPLLWAPRALGVLGSVFRLQNIQLRRRCHDTHPLSLS